MTEDGDAAKDPVSFDKARLPDLSAQGQTKSLPLQVQTKPLSLSKPDKKQIFQLSLEQIEYCSTMTELDIAASLDSHFP